jgi:hypothetical protein
MIEINRYSSEDILTWKKTNIKSLYLKIEKNKTTFQVLFKEYSDRAKAVQNIIINATKKYSVNDVEILINLTDIPFNNPYFLSFSATTNCNINIIPNFSFDIWKDNGSKNFYEIKEDILSNKISWDDKIDKIFWSGINSHQIRKKMNELKINSRYEYNLIHSYDNPNFKFIPLKDHGNYKYLLDLEGMGYSGRFPYLALTGSCVIVLQNTDPDRDYRLYYDDKFIENIHYIKIRYDSDMSVDEINNMILQKINESNCKEIAENCQKLAISYFSEDQVSLYIANILNFYSEKYEKSNIKLNPEIQYSITNLHKSKLYKIINQYR